MLRIDSFEELDCWKACRELIQFINKKVLPQLPSEERYRLVDQLIRASRSATANIAEGFGRRHFLDNSKFIRNSLGSLHECLDQLIAAVDEGLISDVLIEKFRPVFQSISGAQQWLCCLLSKSR